MPLLQFTILYWSLLLTERFISRSALQDVRSKLLDLSSRERFAISVLALNTCSAKNTLAKYVIVLCLLHGRRSEVTRQVRKASIVRNPRVVPKLRFTTRLHRPRCIPSLGSNNFAFMHGGYLSTPRRYAYLWLNIPAAAHSQRASRPPAAHRPPCTSSSAQSQPPACGSGQPQWSIEAYHPPIQCGPILR